MKLNKYEQALIQCIRGLEFEDLLDAFDGINNKAEEATVKALKRKQANDTLNAEGFIKRSESLKTLSVLLADSNADYRSHIDPEDSQEVAKDGLRALSTQKQKSMKQLTDGLILKNVDEDKILSFREFLNEFVDEIFQGNGWIDEIVHAADDSNIDWAQVYNYVGPIAHRVLSEAIQEDKELYFELVSAIISAYDKLKAQFLEQDRHYWEHEAPFNQLDISCDPHSEEEREKNYQHLTKAAELLKEGWTFERLDDNTDNDGHFYLILNRPVSEKSNA